MRKKYWLRVKMIVQANTPKKWAGVVIFISAKRDFRPKLVRRYSEVLLI
jgi:hypothetical protein